VQANSPLFNVCDYGATGNGTTDDTMAVRAAIAAASSSSSPTGNTVYLPAGTYRVTSELTIPPGLTLQGCGWNTPGSQANTFAGSWLYVPAGAGFSPIRIAGSGGAVRNLAFNVPDQATTSPPASAEPMVLITANNALVEDICLYNPYGGIYVNGGAQAVIRRIWGQPLQYGITIDGSQDTNYIDGVHFWPYWQPYTTAIGAYQLANGTAIALFRSDNPHISNVFAFNYNIGISLAGSPAGIPHKVHLVNADFDGCVTGIYIAAPGAPGNHAAVQMSNVTIQSPTRPGVPKGNGIWVEAGSAYSMLQVSNLRISSSGLEAVRIDAGNVQFFGENVSIENWAGSTGFYISSSSSFAWLGVGFAWSPSKAPYAPKSQFHLART